MLDNDRMDLSAMRKQLERAMGIVNLAINSLDEDSVSMSDSLEAAVDILMDAYSAVVTAQAGNEQKE